MTILDKIAAERRDAVKQLKAAVPEKNLERLASQRKHHSLTAALRDNSGRCIVAEIKKASPSAGVLCPDFRPDEIARSYVSAGADGLSILTEPRHFMGSLDDVKTVRAVTDLPILRKDFMVDPYQVTEAAACGADVILIIVAMLDRQAIRELYEKSLALGLEVLVESHNEQELEIACELPEAVLGINNRDLKTLKTDLAISRRIAPLIPSDRLSMAESGISSHEEISELASLGFDGFLIGEALLRGRLSL